MVSDSMDRQGPDNFSTLKMKGHVLNRARAHSNSSGLFTRFECLSVDIQNISLEVTLNKTAESYND